MTMYAFICYLWDRENYIVEPSKQLNDGSVYKSTKCEDKILQDLAEKSSGIFKGLKQKGKIIKEQLGILGIIAHKKATNLGKMYLLPKIYKRLHSALGRPDLSNCEKLKEKALELLDNKLK